MPRHRIAIVEDNPELLADLAEFLDLRGFSTRSFSSAEAFFETWPALSFDLLLLDVALPGMSGLDIVQQVRACGEAAAMPGVVMLTALDANDDQVLGLNAGADVYLSKRSSLEVIEAACHSVLRRLGRNGAGGHWRLHIRHWRLSTPDGTLLDLTHPEVALLTALCGTPGRAVTREALLAGMEKQATLSNLRNLDNTASRLRRKVQAACGRDLPLRPSYGRGYTFTGNCEIEQ